MGGGTARSLTSTATASGVVGPLVGGGLFGFFIGQCAPVRLRGSAFLVGAPLFAVALGPYWRDHPNGDTNR